MPPWVFRVTTVSCSSSHRLSGECPINADLAWRFLVKSAFEGDDEGVQGWLPAGGPACAALPGRSSSLVARYRHFSAAASLGKWPRAFIDALVILSWASLRAFDLGFCVLGGIFNGVPPMVGAGLSQDGVHSPSSPG